jgi:hypothetical protein
MKTFAPAAVILVAACAATAPAPPLAAGQHEIAVKALALGAHGTRERDPAALTEAERLLAGAGARPVEGSADAAEDWRRQLRTITGKDSTPPLRGRALGSAYKLMTLAGGGALTLEQIFLAGKKAKVSLVPTEPGELALAIAGDDGKHLCARNATEGPASCSWLPAWTTRYRIEVRNPGRRVASLYLVID